ncbi:polyprenyl synthetase family protein [Kitasatospora sp. NPDC059571]|uniref:polyprenyl synthetase family protein n=1 Tax=Kitasatospora sp. NPDC059571 TaxID=3346871 RepID=UPI0036773FFB
MHRLARPTRDQASLRRGRPAVWAVNGTAAAILTGNALVVAAVQALLAASEPDLVLPSC